jgi:hypothetical protein
MQRTDAAMIEDEIIKHIPDAVSVAKVAAASIPFTAIVKRMLGPAADELAEMWRDQVRLYRYERQLKCVEKAERMAKYAGFTPQAVPPKILFPLLEGASFEENETLHDMWAALLANAASLEGMKIVRPGFISTLKQMAPDEADLLNTINSTHFKDITKNLGDPFSLSSIYNFNEYLCALSRLTEGFTEVGPQPSLRFTICLHALENAGLVEGFSSMTPLRTTLYGHVFLQICNPPKAKSNS